MTNGADCDRILAMKQTLIQAIVAAVEALKTCQKRQNREMALNWKNIILQCEDFLPHGSGFDSGTHIDIDASDSNKIVLETSFHHMNQNGFYVGWTDHKISITPSFSGFDISIGGYDRNGIKEMMHECLHCDLSAIVEMDKDWTLKKA